MKVHYHYHHFKYQFIFFKTVSGEHIYFRFSAKSDNIIVINSKFNHEIKNTTSCAAVYFSHPDVYYQHIC